MYKNFCYHFHSNHCHNDSYYSSLRLNHQSIYLYHSNIDLSNGGALELLNKSLKTGAGRVLDGRGVFPIVCLSNIRTTQQQNAFFLNVLNNDFNAQDFNKDASINPESVRRGCPIIVNGADEDAVATAVSAKILTDKKVYSKLIAE